jgi:protein-S-isoprenylcysteine O-methyltransferase Ste14
MFHDPFHWFPDPYFSTVLFIFILGVYVIDYYIPKMFVPHQTGKPIVVQDRSSFYVIQAVGIVSIVVAMACRYMDWTITPVAVQYFGLLLIPAGLALREWAIIKLGRFFSRTVQIEPGHQLITDGPYRWIRHPAYTGMVIIYFGIALSLGSWLGAIAALLMMLSATLYRISVEEKVLIEAFGDEYRGYMKRTWKLFPGW